MVYFLSFWWKFCQAMPAIFESALTREHDDDLVRPQLLYFRQRFKPVHSWHSDIQEDNIERSFRNSSSAFLPVDAIETT
jgi:hypothetical protein